MGKMTYAGLLDAYASEKEMYRRNDHVPAFVTNCVALYTKEYEGRTERITSAIYITVPGKTEKHDITAVWDTGAMTSSISTRLAEKLRIEPIDEGIGVSASGEVGIKYYSLNVHISDEIEFKKLRVSAFPLTNHKDSMLIGMDIISKGRFIIDNVNGNTVFTFEKKKAPLSNMLGGLFMPKRRKMCRTIRIS